MSELTDDQLDGLFRKSAEEFEPPFDPAAWQDMKARLDGNERTRSATNWKDFLRWGLSILLLLLLTGGAWYTYRKTNVTNQSTALPRKPTSVATNDKIAQEGFKPKTSRLGATDSHSSPMVKSNKPDDEEVNPSPNRNGIVAEPTSPTNESTNADQDVAKTVTATGERATKASPSSYKSVTDPRNPIDSKRLPTTSVISKKERVVSRFPGTVVRKISERKRRNKQSELVAFSASNNAISATPSFSKQRRTYGGKENQPTVSDANGNGVKAEPNSTSLEATRLPTLAELAIRPARWPRPLAFASRPVMVMNSDTVVKKLVSKPFVQRGLSVRLAVAPDLSGVGLKNFSRPGTNVGVLLEYRLAQRWSVQAGIIQSTKVYKASASQYGYWPEYIANWTAKPIGVDGSCNMFDIPINVRYDVILKPRQDDRPPSRWFISGGVTSYILKREDYTYIFTDYTHVYPAMKGQSASTGGYGFSNMNLSVGYERALSRRLSWQVEPFMKVPLKGVGYFKIDLLSTGAFFSLRYKL